MTPNTELTEDIFMKKKGQKKNKRPNHSFIESINSCYQSLRDLDEVGAAQEVRRVPEAAEHQERHRP